MKSLISVIFYLSFNIFSGATFCLGDTISSFQEFKKQDTEDYINFRSGKHKSKDINVDSSKTTERIQSTRVIDIRQSSSAFNPTEDFWHFGNEGSYYAPYGFATAQSILAYWHYLHGKSAAGPLKLYANVDNKKIWEDDNQAIYLISKAENNFDHKSWNEIHAPLLNTISDESSFSAIVNQISKGASPALLALRSSKHTTTLILIAYAVTENSISILDPNIPNRNGRIEYDRVLKKFRSYKTKQNINGTSVEFDWIKHAVPSDIPGWSQLAVDWGDYPYVSDIGYDDSDLVTIIDDPVYGRQDECIYFYSRKEFEIMAMDYPDDVPPFVISNKSPSFKAKWRYSDKQESLFVRILYNGKWYAGANGDCLPKINIKSGFRGILDTCIFAKMDDGTLKWVARGVLLLSAGPMILDVSPRAAWEGKGIIVSGVGFGNLVGKVKIGNYEALVIPSDTSSSKWWNQTVFVYVPDGIPVGMHDVYVIDANGVKSNPFAIRILPTGWTPRDSPKVKRVGPNHGAMSIVGGKPWSRPYTVYGDGFGIGNFPDDKVTIGGRKVPITRWYTDSIRFKLTPKIKSGKLIVTAKYIKSKPHDFTIVRPKDIYVNVSNIVVKMRIPIICNTVAKSNDNDDHTEIVTKREHFDFIKIEKRLTDIKWTGNCFIQNEVEEVKIQGKSALKKTTYSGSFSDDCRKLLSFNYTTDIDLRYDEIAEGNPAGSKGGLQQTITVRIRGLDINNVGIVPGEFGTPEKADLQFNVRLGNDVRKAATVLYKSHSESTNTNGYNNSKIDFSKFDHNFDASFSLEKH